MSSDTRMRREQLLQRALAVFVQWRDAPVPADPAALIALHPELREYLEQLLVAPVVAEPVASAGSITLGEFRLLREIGRGGMGVVHEAVQESLGRRVALKLLPPLSALSPTALARFQAEAELIARLDHPGIVRILARGATDGTHWLAMELVTGDSLDRLIERERSARQAPTTATGSGGDGGWVRFVVEITVQVADALDHGHRVGVVHRDVKPANILIRRDGTAVLTDFGLARDLAAPALTRTGAVAGTPFYMSPEQARDGRMVTGRSDVFSLGATLYEALTLTLPFPGEASDQVIRRILTSEPPAPDRVDTRLDGDLAAVVLRALDKDLGRRYPTAAAFADDLRAYLAGRPITARRATTRERVRRWARREPVKAALVAVLALAVPMVTGLLGYLLAAAPVIREGSTKLRSDRFEELLAVGLPLVVEHEDALLPRVRREGGRWEALFREALALQPDSAEAITGMTLGLWNADRLAEAVALLDAQADRSPSMTRVVRRLRWHLTGAAGSQPPPADVAELFVEAVITMRLAERGRPELFADALNLFHRLVERSPRARLAYHAQWAHVAGHVGDRTEIARAAQALEELWPTSANAWFWIGFAWLHLDARQAAAALRRARALGADDRRLFMDLAKAEAHSGDNVAAAAAYRDLLARDPEYGDAWFGLGLVLDAPADEAFAFRRLLELEPRHQLGHYNLGVALNELGDRDAALAEFRIAVELDPNHAESHVNLGSELFLRGERTAAVEHFAAAVRLARDLEIAHDRLVRALVAVGREADAAAERERWARR